MARDWDEDKGGRDQWIAWLTSIMSEALRVLKPGGHALVWSIPRTSHWTGMALEDAGFEIRDCVSHIFATGFPKSQNISKAIDRAAGARREVVGSYRVSGNALTPLSEKGGTYGVGVKNSEAGELLITAPATDAAKQWDGWGTALKPAVENWWLCRKPIEEKTITAQVLQTGTGALNVGECRIGTSKDVPASGSGKHASGFAMGGATDSSGFDPSIGRWPANLVLSHNADCDDQKCSAACAVAMLDAQSGNRRGMSGGGHHRAGYAGGMFGAIDCSHTARGDSGGASRFFYCAKASTRDREEGLEDFEATTVNDGRQSSIDNAYQRGETRRLNIHPTVKATSLMRYLCRLVTPPNGVVLDPFCGSGSTGKGAILEGFQFIGIDQSVDYCRIANARIEHVWREYRQLHLFPQNDTQPATGT